jgi:CRP/FNR family transcriptional regulator, cyclic AMP receptor protein
VADSPRLPHTGVMTNAGRRWSPGSFLAGLDERRQEELIALGVPRSLPSGRMLFREGEASSTHAEVLVHGFVKVTALEDGVAALLSIRGPGDLVGESPTLIGRPRTATVTASGPVVAVVIKGADFRGFLNSHPEAAVVLAATMAERLRWANRRRSEITAYPAHVRLARLLADLGDSYGEQTPDGVRVGALISQPELASMIGVATTTGEKALGRLVRAGLVRTGYRRITILDRDGLLAITEAS